MESRIKICDDKHNLGYNCCQAIACTYCDLFGIDEDTAFKMTEGFGFGMGGAQSTCGAISGAIAVLGMKNSVGTSNTTTKRDTYKKAAEIAKMFEAKNGATICKELKGIGGGKVLRSCPGCIQDAAEIVESFVLGEE